MKALLGIAFFSAVAIISAASLYDSLSTDTYKVKGYEHAMMLCGRQGMIYTVDYGHGDDVQAQEVLRQGMAFCSSINK